LHDYSLQVDTKVFKYFDISIALRLPRFTPKRVLLKSRYW